MGRNVKWNNLFLLGEDEIFFERERERERGSKILWTVW